MLTEQRMAALKFIDIIPVINTSDRLRVLSTLEEFRAIKSQWDDLLCNSEVDCPFLRHEWLVNWWECFGAGAALHIVLWEANNRLLGGAPLMQTRRKIFGIPVRTFEFLANGHSYRSGIVVESKRRSQFLYHLYRYFQEWRRKWSLLWLRDIPEGAGIIEFFSQPPGDSHISLECPMASPYVCLEGTWKEYWLGRSAHFRANLRRREKNLSQFGKITFKAYDGCEHVARMLPVGLELEASGWKGRAGSAILKSSETISFYSRIANWAAENGWLRLYFLFLEDKAIAFDLALDYAGRIYLLKIGHDENHSRFSPGQLLRMRTLEAAFASGCREYDFLGFDMPWKMEWTTDVRVHRTVVIYGRGPLPKALYMWQQRLLPTIRKSQKLQVALRSLRRSEK